MCIYVYVFRSHLQSTLRDRKERSSAQGGAFFPTFRKGAKSVGVKPKIWINYRHKTERIARDIYILKRLKYASRACYLLFSRYLIRLALVAKRRSRGLFPSRATSVCKKALYITANFEENADSFCDGFVRESDGKPT